MSLSTGTYHCLSGLCRAKCCMDICRLNIQLFSAGVVLGIRMRHFQGVKLAGWDNAPIVFLMDWNFGLVAMQKDVRPVCRPRNGRGTCWSFSPSTNLNSVAGTWQLRPLPQFTSKVWARRKPSRSEKDETHGKTLMKNRRWKFGEWKNDIGKRGR